MRYVTVQTQIVAEKRQQLAGCTPVNLSASAGTRLACNQQERARSWALARLCAAKIIRR